MFLFDPDELHEIAKASLDAGDRPAIIDAVIRELKARYPDAINDEVPWLYNNAGGAMGQMKLLHCSLREYILLFGTPIGTEGHSGRYSTEVYDFMLDGEMWCSAPASARTRGAWIVDRRASSATRRLRGR